jgi:putative intracellular protease/amidase
MGAGFSAFQRLRDLSVMQTPNLDNDMSMLKLLTTPASRNALASTALLASVALSSTAQAAGHGKVLVVLSSEQVIALRDGKSYNAGYYLDELEIPLRKMVEAGFTPIFTNPKGNTVTFDPASNDKLFYGNDDSERAKAVNFLDGIAELKQPRTLKKVWQEGTNDYVGIFIPGGWSPMQDLVQDKELGKILLTFHTTGRPTGVICHGPAALLSAIPEATAFVAAMSADNYDGARKLAEAWPYSGYRITVFSRSEEHVVEGAKGQLGGDVRFYAADGLAQAGAHVDRLSLWTVNVVEDREVVSGQQPFSSDAFGDAFVAKLKAFPKN